VRIAFTHAYCWPEVRRGAERFTQELGAALCRRGHEVVILSAAWKPGKTVLDGVTTIRLRRFFRHPDRHEADCRRRLFPRLVRGRFDAVHSLGRHDAIASIRAARFHRGRRTVFTDLGLPDRAWWKARGRGQARAVGKVVAGIDVYSCMSQYALDYLARDWGRSDGVVVPGGVNLGSFVPASAREPRPTILFSGAFLESHKEVPLLLEALAIVAESEPAVELWLSGPGEAGPLLAAARPEARERTRVLGVGDPNRQHERYGRAWLTCLPTTQDSFGMALVESLACGTPLVTTTQGAPKELVTEGVTGELCRPRDPEDLARACLRAFHLASRPETVEACRASAEPFDWDKGLAPWAERLYTGSAEATR
jgi:glycosyltransferase involved in cell wall biosynthesis